MNPSTQAPRLLRCEGMGAINRGCFNLADLGKLTEPEFRAQFGLILCLACYIYDWARPHKPVYRARNSHTPARLFPTAHPPMRSDARRVVR